MAAAPSSPALHCVGLAASPVARTQPVSTQHTCRCPYREAGSGEKSVSLIYRLHLEYGVARFPLPSRTPPSSRIDSDQNACQPLVLGIPGFLRAACDMGRAAIWRGQGCELESTTSESATPVNDRAVLVAQNRQKKPVLLVAG